MDTDRNLRFDYIIDAAHINTVIRRLQLEPFPTEQVEAMMFQWMLKKLEQLRESCLSQGLNGINPGFGENQTPPPALLKELVK